jgi:hypothetical protein
MDISNYDKIKEDARAFYSKANRVYCPALSGEVSFGAEGFNHLIYKGKRNERDKDVQIMKFKMLPRALDLVGLTTTYQEYEESLQEVDVMRFKKRMRETKVIRYWGFIAIIANRKIKVIVRQMGDNGQKHFWSVIPAWVTSQHRDIKLISTMKGNAHDD